MTSRCEQIRQFLKSQPEPQRASQVAIGIGMPGDIKVSFTLATMCREGSIKKEGNGKMLYYSFVHDVKPRASREEAKANLKAYEARREAARKAKRAADAIAAGRKPGKSPDFRLRSLAKPIALKSAPQAKTVTAHQLNTLAAAVAGEKKDAPAPSVRFETVDEFVARGGEVQVLHPWDTSRPLRFLSDRFIELD